MSIRLHDKWYKELTMRLPQMTTGKIFYVDTNTGSDSNSGRYQFAPKATIQSAVDAVTDGRGDVVIVGAGRYYENVRITKSKMTLMGAQAGGKQSVSIRPGGAGVEGADHAEATTVYGFSSLAGVAVRGAAVTINATSVELCGLDFDASSFQYTSGSYYLYCGVYIGDGYRINTSYNYDCNGSYIHDCVFKRGVYGIIYDGASEDHRLQHNHFYRCEGGTSYGFVFIDPGGNRQTERVTITDNIFQAIGNGSYGIYGYNTAETHDCIVARNIFHERDGKTITFAINYIGAGEWAILGNWYGCAEATSANLGTGCWNAGNYSGQAGAAPTTKFITEA